MQHVIIILYINQGPLKEVVQQGLTLFLSKAGGPGPWKSFILLIQGIDYGFNLDPKGLTKPFLKRLKLINHHQLL